VALRYQGRAWSYAQFWQRVEEATRALGVGRGERIAWLGYNHPDMLALPVDNLDLAISNSGLDLLNIFERDPFTKDLSLGVLDVHSHRIESPTEVKERIMRGVGVLPKEQIWVDPDCGLKTRTVEETVGKLRAMQAAVRQVRAGAV